MEAVSLKESCAAAIEEVAKVGFGPFSAMAQDGMTR